MKTTRRDFLKTAGALSVLPIGARLAGCGDDGGDESPTFDDYSYDGALGPEGLFGHGVASGDPLPDAVILWTRVSGGSADPIEVWWEIAEDPAFEHRVQVGTKQATSETDFTMKVDALGLTAGTTYHYRFFALGRQSPVGRTRTAPAGETDHVTFAVVSCSKYAAGYFHAYGAVAERSGIDAVVHLGDYIYEGGDKGFVAERDHAPAHELVTLADYRMRYSQYRADTNLQAAHQQHPFICVWDDHESANNSWKDGASAHQTGDEGSWEDRKATSIRVWHEWLPVREQADGRIYRRMKYGDLVDLMMLDTRLHGRDEPVPTHDTDALADPDRSILGADQEAWLDQALVGSTARWKLLGQQVMLAPLTAAGEVLNNDQWDGYQAARDRLIASIDKTPNVVVLTGDIHSSWANEVPRDVATYDAETGEGSACVEFIAPGITAGFPLDEGLVDLAKQLNPHVRYGEVTHRGYVLLDLDAERAHASWYHFADVQNPNDTQFFDAAWSVATGQTRLTEAKELT